MENATTRFKNAANMEKHRQLILKTLQENVDISLQLSKADGKSGCTNYLKIANFFLKLRDGIVALSKDAFTVPESIFWILKQALPWKIFQQVQEAENSGELDKYIEEIVNAIEDEESPCATTNFYIPCTIVDLNAEDSSEDAEETSADQQLTEFLLKHISQTDSDSQSSENINEDHEIFEGFNKMKATILFIMNIYAKEGLIMADSSPQSFMTCIIPRTSESNEKYLERLHQAKKILERTKGKYKMPFSALANQFAMHAPNQTRLRAQAATTHKEVAKQKSYKALKKIVKTFVIGAPPICDKPDDEPKRRGKPKRNGKQNGNNNDNNNNGDKPPSGTNDRPTKNDQGHTFHKFCGNYHAYGECYYDRNSTKYVGDAKAKAFLQKKRQRESEAKSQSLNSKRTRNESAAINEIHTQLKSLATSLAEIQNKI